MRILQKTVRLADPHMCTDGKDRLNVLTAIFDALVRRAPAGDLVPALASGWNVEDDARTWTFRLRGDVTFHDGERLRAGDVTASLARACDPAVGGELGTEGVWAAYLGDAEVSARDDATVRVVTARPMADLLELLVDVPIVPRGALADMPGVYVGSGPCRLLEHGDGRAVLEPFRASAVRGSPAAALEWQAEPDDHRRAEALRLGHADLATLASRRLADAAAASGVRVLAHESNLCVAFLFDAARGPGADRAFRRAVNHAVDVPRMLAAAIDGAGTRLNGPLTPLHFGCDPALAPYAHDPERARSLLAESDAARKVVIDVPTSLPDEAPLLGEMLAEDLGAVGVDATVRRFEDRTAYAHRVKAKAIDDLCCFDSSPLSTYRVLREKLDSTVAGPWWQGYHDPRVNDLLDAASRTVDDAKRRDVYRRAYRIIHDDAPWVFLYRPTTYWGAGAAAGEVTVGPDGLLRTVG